MAKSATKTGGNKPVKPTPAQGGKKPSATMKPKGKK